MCELLLMRRRQLRLLAGNMAVDSLGCHDDF